MAQVDGVFRCIAPDLAGHGAAPRLARYGLAPYGEELIARVGGELGVGPVIIVGHSLGGAVGLSIAGRHPGLAVQAVLALSCKTVWTEQDFAGMARVADKGVATFDDEQAAMERFCKVSGLTGLVPPEFARGGVRPDGSRWRLAVDPETHRTEPIDFDALLQSVPCPVLLGTGEHDAMAPGADLARFGLPVRTIAGAGHNVHVEDPAAVASLLAALHP